MLADLVDWFDALVFAALAFLSFREGKRHGQAAAFWLAGTFSTLAGALLVGRLDSFIPEESTIWVLRLVVAVIVLYPYLLYRFVAELDKSARRFHPVALSATALVVVGGLLLPDMTAETEPSAFVTAFLVALVGQWTLLSVLVAVRLWRTGTEQPSVARRRLRLMSLASLGLDAALVLAAVGAQTSQEFGVVTELFLVASGLLFFLGFAPPHALREMWRREELEQFRRATVKLMVATSAEEVTSSILPHMVALIGGTAAALIDKDGQVLGSHLATEEMLAAMASAGSSDGSDASSESQVLRLEFSFGCAVVWTGAFTPLFGQDEIQMLRSLGVLTAIALERAMLFSRERQGRRALEKANQELESATAELEQEVAERRRAEEELIESQMQLAEAQEITFLGSWSWDVENDKVFWSDHLYRIFGVDPQSFEATFDAFVELVHPDDREFVRGVIEALFEGEDSFAIDHRIVRPDSRQRFIHARGKVIRDVTGRPIKLIGTSQDITRRKQAEEALRGSEMRFRNVAQTASEAIVTADTNGLITFWNRGAHELFGYWEDEIVGKPIKTLMPERFREAHTEGFDRYQRTGVPTVIGTTIELAGLRQDGSEFPVELSLSTWDVEGERFFTGILRDMSERKAAEAELQRLSRHNELVLNAAGEGIYGLDPDGFVQFVNPAGAGMLGYSVEELMGKPLHQLIHHTRLDGTPFPVTECPIHLAMKDGAVHRVVEDHFWRKDGTTFPVEYVAAPLREEDEEISGAVVVYRDTSERREFERMKELERLKDEFVSVVSHELRTPLTSIRGALGLLASGLLGEVPERGHRMLEIAITNTDRLVRLINEILDVQRMQSGEIPMRMQTCDTGRLLEEVRDVMQPMAEEAGVELILDARRAPLWGDPDHLVQVLTNLVSNAIKFSGPGRRVWLEAEPGEGHVQFAVRDEGRGIPEDKLELVFERFAQVDASDARERGGTGLGLAISKSVVELHGGRIWVESRLGEGATFYFTIPDSEPAERPTEVAVDSLLEPASPTADLGPVLVCDDDASSREVVANLLRERGYEVVTAASGEEAVDLAPRVHPCAIVLDLLMPGISGWETVAALKRDPSTEDIPIVITSQLSPSQAPAPPGSDVVDWLNKPLDERSLLEALQRAAGRRGTIRVLVVEDDEDLARVVAATFERHGLETFHARTGREAIRLSQELTPDLLILDLLLPEGDGYSVVEWLRQHERLHLTPMVVYTVADLDPGQKKRLKLGETIFLTKGRVSPGQFERQVLGLLNLVARRTPDGEETDSDISLPGTSTN